MIKPRKNYSILTEDEFLKRFVLRFILEENQKEGVGVYPSFSSSQITISDTINPKKNLYVISGIEREDFEVIDLKDSPTQIKVLCQILGLERAVVTPHLKKKHKEHLFSCLLMISFLPEKNEITISRTLNLLSKDISFKNKLEVITDFVMNPSRKTLSPLLEFYNRDDMGSLMYILESLVSGTIDINQENQVFLKRLLEVSIQILKSSSSESAIVSLIGMVK